jgi:hypothetical protein
MQGFFLSMFVMIDLHILLKQYYDPE